MSFHQVEGRQLQVSKGGTGPFKVVCMKADQQIEVRQTEEHRAERLAAEFRERGWAVRECWKVLGRPRTIEMVSVGDAEAGE